MDDLVELRCKSCGAPIDVTGLDPNSPYVTCQYCGTSQQRMDAKKYMDDMMIQIKTWLSNAMPVGMGVEAGENVDPVARHSIFINDVKPRIESELESYRFSNLSLLGNTLLTVPFNSTTVCATQHSPNTVFELNAKARSVAPLAVTPEDKELITTTSVITQSYALTLNNVKLLSEVKDGRWSILATNFREGAKAMADLPSYSLACERFEALGDVSEGFAYFMEGNIGDATASITAGRDKLLSVKDRVFSDPQMSIMYMGIEQEVNIANIVLDIAGFVYTMGGDPLQTMNIVKDVINAKPAQNPRWNFLTGNQNRFNEIFGEISKVINAKNGGEIPVADGQGDILVPFWEVDLRYTFVTGKLWSKKSVEVKDDILICADFVMDPACLDNPASALTDIFRYRPESSIIESFCGDETRISSGTGIGKIQDSVKMRSASGRKIVLPLSTKAEAEKACVDYLAQTSKSYSKFKLSQPVVQRIVYVPCTSSNGRLVLPNDFGNMEPDHIARMSQNSIFIV